MLAAALAVPALASGVTLADYGDAPDGVSALYPSNPGVIGHFQSLEASDGIRHTQVGPLRLGPGADRERDSRQVDRDGFDDGFSVLLRPCQMSEYTFFVNAARLPADLRTSGHTAFLNAWFDWNSDGDWDDDSNCFGRTVGEDVIQNAAIDMGRFERDPVQAVTIRAPAGRFVGGKPTKPSATNFWYRASVTLDVPVLGPRGSSQGLFTDGETEDYLRLPGLRKPPPKPNFAAACNPNPLTIAHGVERTVNFTYAGVPPGPPRPTVVLLGGGAPDVTVTMVGTPPTGFKVKGTADNRKQPVQTVVLKFQFTYKGQTVVRDCRVKIIHATAPPSPQTSPQPSPKFDASCTPNPAVFPHGVERTVNFAYVGVKPGDKPQVLRRPGGQVPKDVDVTMVGKPPTRATGFKVKGKKDTRRAPAIQQVLLRFKFTYKGKSVVRECLVTIVHTAAPPPGFAPRPPEFDAGCTPNPAAFPHGVERTVNFAYVGVKAGDKPQVARVEGGRVPRDVTVAMVGNPLTGFNVKGKRDSRPIPAFQPVVLRFKFTYMGKSVVRECRVIIHHGLKHPFDSIQQGPIRVPTTPNGGMTTPPPDGSTPAPTPSPGDGGTTSGDTSKTVPPEDQPPYGGSGFPHCNPGFFVDVYIPENAQEPITHQILLNDPPCPNATVTAEKFGPGVTPPNAPQPTPAGKKVYRVTITSPDNVDPAQFRIKVSWTNP